jgi:hypothetical protein
MVLTMRTRAFRRALVAAVLVGGPQLVLYVGCGTETLAAQLIAADPRVEVMGIIDQGWRSIWGSLELITAHSIERE